jgi:putative FmdB family regulatory protein
MPLYDYVCRECKKKFQIVEPIGRHDPKRVSCPKCRSKKVDRLWTGVNVHTSKKS